MFIILPVAVDYRARRYPVVTFTLMGLNAAMYLVSLCFFWTNEFRDLPILFNLGLIPAEATWYTWLTSMFVHGGFFHFAGNMVYLFLFGATVEDMMGRFRFSLFYLGGGLLAALSQVLLTTGDGADIPIVGASGAISACIGAFLIVLPKTEIQFRYWGFFLRGFEGEFWLRAWIVISFWFLMDFASLVLHLGWGGTGGGVAFGAHVGGTAAGALAMWIIRSLPSRRAEASARPTPAAALAATEAPEDPSEPADVFLFVDGQQIGPFAPSKVRSMIALGAVSQDACFWREGMGEWQSIACFD